LTKQEKLPRVIDRLLSLYFGDFPLCSGPINGGKEGYYTQKCVKLLVHGGSLGCSQCDSCETILHFITRLCIIRIWYLFPLQAKYPWLIHSVRGVGTFCVFDRYSTETRNKLVLNLRNRGD